MDLAEAAELLYAAPWEGFMALRTEQVKAAKAAGDKDLAKQIGQLRKPTRSAWLVNLLARAAPDEIGGLLELGAALRDAQRGLDGEQLRTLSRQRNSAIGALARQAVELGAAAGYPATEAVRQEVSQTLQAALADPEQADLVRRGVTSQAVSYGGFGPFDLSAATPTDSAPPAQPDDDQADDQTDDQADDPAEADEAKAAEAARQQAQAAWERARDELAAGEADADRATTEADGLADQVEELRQQLRAAEAAEEQARKTARQARGRVEKLAAEEQAARQELEKTR